MELDPASLDQSARYRLLIALVAPRPIAFVSTVDRAGRLNLAPFSFFSGLGSEPMTALFCPANRPDGREKDSLANAKPAAEGGCGEFVINAAVEAYAREVAAAGEPLPLGQSEFELTGLAPAPSTAVRPPRVARAPWAFECRTLEVRRYAPGQPGGANLVVGRIVHVHLDDALLDAGGRVDPARLAPIGRLGGITYCTARQRFDVPLGRAALGIPDPLAGAS
jgi:flavin reductase (DIM6/NTAB) family NADH-FMN oxidoreductase RutF